MSELLDSQAPPVRSRPPDARSRLGARARSKRDRCVAVDKVIAAMHQRLDRPFALDEMARLVYLSPFYFSRVFRDMTGVPPRRFHTALRIAAAKRLLITTDLSVTEVCLEVGYQSLGTFTTNFHELVGVSPRELRRLAAGPRLTPAELAGTLAGDDEGELAVEGSVLGAGEDRLVFVGLFRQPYPVSLPVACTAVTGASEYTLRTSATGRFHVAAAAFAPVCGCLDPEAGPVLVAAGTRPVRLRPGCRSTRDLRLRPVRTTDPPILLALPLPAGRRPAARTAEAVSGAPS
jgi:AraC family transcriptional regulator